MGEKQWIDSSAVGRRVNTALKALLERQVADGRQIGAQVCAYKDGEKIVDAWAGRMGPGDDRPVGPDSLFMSYSVTKGVAATALHVCADRGLIDYKEKVSKYWPRFGQNGKEKITIEQVLSHQAGLHVTPLPFETLYDWDATIRYIEELKPAYEPGTSTAYHAVNFGHIIGGLIQAVTGIHVKDFIRREIAEPLSVADELFVGIPDGVEDRLTSLEVWDIPGMLARGVPFPPDWSRAMPEECWTAANTKQWRKACVPAGNGHFTARALARMYGALACGGSIDGVQLLSPERIGLMSRLVTKRLDTVTGAEVNRSLGFILGGPAGGIVGAIGPRLSAFGHGGAGGSTAFADPDIGLSVAVTLNKMEFAPTRTLELCNLIRKELGVE